MSLPLIRSPRELMAMSLEQLQQLAEDLRQAILSACLKNGGHLGASLGAVELAIALHRCFESPREPLVWDVGHQAYAHKLLTGRWERFETLRTWKGISGFLSRSESEHDVFGAGHSSTALSAALGIAWWKGQSEKTAKDWTVAVVGDGGLTAGLALEALNNVRALDLAPFLLLLNDNQMSISPNVGALSAILASGEAKHFFESFGFHYMGPMDGHDLSSLIGTLQGIKEQDWNKPVLLHVMTQKGKGYIPAEESPAHYHGVNPLQAKLPEKTAAPKQKTFSEAFGEALTEMAEADPRIVAITAAMPEGTGLSKFARKFPERFFDVGIAEPHAVTFAAGMATQGVRPVVAIYSTFLQRALDSIIHDVALQGLGVIFAIDRAGLVGADGPTHHGAFDLAYLSMIPGMRVVAPSCLSDLRELLVQATRGSGPWAIRYPRGGGAESLETEPDKSGVRWHSLPDEPELALISLGPIAARVLEIASELDPERKRIAVISTYSCKPVPPSLIEYLLKRPGLKTLTFEEGVAQGGFGQSLLYLARSGQGQAFGYADRFAEHGSVAQLDVEQGLSPAKIRESIRSCLR